MPYSLLDPAIILILMLGISRFRTPRAARFGNLLAAMALVCAMAITFGRHELRPLPLILAAAGSGGAAGWLVAVRAGMVQIPAMVATQNGLGGLAASLVSLAELTRAAEGSPTPATEWSAALGLIVGVSTFSGSIVAAGKLANRLRQTPLFLPRHNTILAVLAGATCGLTIAAASTADAFLVGLSVGALVTASAVLGIVFSIRVGGADMPVLISFLNTMSAVAAALCGIVIHSRLLIACGAMVAASGLILTYAMCRAMNRGLANVFAGIQPNGLIGPAEPASPDRGSGLEAVVMPGISAATSPHASEDDAFVRALAVAKAAEHIIIVPGYGLALADAQTEVVQLAEKLGAMGKTVLFAIHPIAGRMPGHMHVLLAEAEVDYGMIRELKEVNSEFANTDLALIVGACDVVNPAAIESTGTPISGMPILRAHEARNVLVCNLDDRPGYSGVDNPLYRDPRTILLLGDAKPTLIRLLEELD